MVTGQLSRETHSSLRILSRNAEAEDVRAFLAGVERLTRPGDRHNADAVLQASIFANKSLYNRIRRESGMCEALRELMKDEIDAAVEEGMVSAVRNLMDSMKWTAEQAMEAIKIPAEERGNYASRL